ncbi:Non-canonical purine NTP pyrophosphatase [Bacteroidales bacterium Barb7]|nr:Non-canonical purine NTP pyrophosphatase [Bacteroidales bacterium Barb7]
MKLIFATNNKHKLEEVRRMLPDGIELVSLADINCREDIPETADTLEGNALQKARYVKEHYGCDCFADDTGLEVETLDNAPGVRSARYAGAGHDSEANMLKLLGNMQGKENWTARFRTVIALLSDGEEHLFDGIVKGKIIEEKRGEGGFGYDPLFVPDGYDGTFAELGSEVKNTISHRALAVQKLCAFLSALCILLVLCVCGTQHVSAQAVGTWKSYMSYYTTTAVAEAADNVFAIAGNSLYSYGKEDQSLRTYSKENGLSDTKISRIGYSVEMNTLLILYDNGNIDLLTDKGIYNIPHLMLNTVVQDKAVNNIFFYKEYACLSANFGIMLVNLSKREIADTYRLNSPVYSVCVYDGKMFAATSDKVLSAPMSSNLLDRNNWETYTLDNAEIGNSIRQICLFQEALCFFQEGAGVYYRQKGGEVRPLLKDNTVKDMTLQNGELILYRPNNAVAFSSLTERRTLNVGAFSGISSLHDGIYWTASGEEGLKGFRKKGNGGEYEWFVSGLLINSPKRDLAAYMTFHNQKLLVAGGGFWADRYRNPGTLMVYENNQWHNFNETAIGKESGIWFADATCVAIDPRDENHYYVSTWGEGVYEFKDNAYVKLHNQKNSPLESSWNNYNTFVRVSGLAFDKNNNLWMNNVDGSVTSHVKVLKPDGTWLAYKYSALPSMPILDKVLVTRNNHVWMNSMRINAGILVIDGKGTDDSSDDIANFYSSFLSPDGQISPSNYYCMAEDLNGQIWLGTSLGPVICPSPANAIENREQMRANRIIRMDNNGINSYFLDGESVRAIAVDGGNRKWLGTQSSGLLIVSENGSETVEHFTTDNSPLPSNFIQSIAINPQTGEAFIGTDKGIVSYMSGAPAGHADYSAVYAFPNPVRPDYQDQVTITGLMPNSNVKITDLNGNLIIQGTSTGGQFTWNCSRRNGERVATGIYLVLSATENAAESVVTKIMVVK